ncbi:glycosyltransferase family 4 protein [Candidatus Bathyarchaeota archaeon]|nr:glycosyltransferase family 4 protein [Candidatus Bathyarchaeota archaeon]
MNVLILSEKLWPEGSGGELATYLYTRLLIENDVNVKVAISSTPNYFEAWSELPIYMIPVLGRGKYTIVPMFKKVRELFKWSDIVYCTDFFPTIPLIKQAFKKPVVVHIHSYFPTCPVGSLYNLKENSICKSNNRNCVNCILYYEKSHRRSSKLALTSTLLNSTVGRHFLSFLKFADALIFVSRAQKTLFLKHAPNLFIPSYVIYNPLPKLSLAPINGDDLGYFGGLSPLKGFHILLKALLKTYHKRQVRIHATKMEHLAGLEPLREIEIVSYGRLYGSSYEGVYKRIRGVVLPSIYQEPLPYVAAEALLKGRLLVATRVGGVPEMAEGLKGALIVKPNDADNLADALDQVLSMDRSEVVELGLKNRKGILKKFDNDRTVNELIRVFERVTNSHE